jgi:hypothetical protein
MMRPTDKLFKVVRGEMTKMRMEIQMGVEMEENTSKKFDEVNDKNDPSQRNHKVCFILWN